jgi:hypothetical protein
MKTLLALLAAVLLASALAACASLEQTIQQDQASDAEQVLREAGFRQIPGDTKPRIDMLRALAPRRLTAVSRDGQLWYVYPDPTNCACLYVGSPANYQTYQQLARDQQLAYDEEILVSEDTPLGWSVWGPWY